jgi:hypothetical protein
VGTPTIVGTYTAILKLTDYLGGYDTFTYTVAITTPPALDVSGLPLSIEVGTYYSGVIRLSGVMANSPGYYIFQGGNGFEGIGGCIVLPPGLDMITSGQPKGTYLVQGFPSSTGNFTLAFVAVPYYYPPNSNGTATVLGTTLGASPVVLRIAPVPVGSLSTGAIAGIAVGSVVGGILLLTGATIATIYLYRYRNRSMIKLRKDDVTATQSESMPYYKF